MNRLRIIAVFNYLAARIAIALFAVTMLALIIISPIALIWLAQLHGINWMSLSNVGQTYGAISALISALALGGVAISILYQARDVRGAREQTNRGIHNELLRMEMEDPFYMEIMAIPWGQGIGLDSYDSLRRNHFIHMWFEFWEGLYVLGDITEREVRYNASNELFVSAYGRRYWSATRKAKLDNNNGRRLKFVKIMDEEYRKIIDSGSPVATLTVPDRHKAAQDNPQQLSRTESGLLILLATGGAILAGRLLTRHFASKP